MWKIFRYKKRVVIKKAGFEGATSSESKLESNGYTLDDQGRIINLYSGEITTPLELEQKKRDLNLSKSIRRTKTTISDLVRCNDWEYLATFTFDKAKIDRYDETACKKALSTWFNNIQRNYGKFDYIAVPEKHKDGALHVHTMINGYKAKLIPAINPRTGEILRRSGRPQFNAPSYTFGFTNFDPIGDKTRTSSYIRKYITKDIVGDNTGKKRYWHSKGLKTPQISSHNLTTLSKLHNVDPDQSKLVFENDVFEIHEISLVKEK